MVDLTGDFEARDPLADYEIINHELSEYASELAFRPRIVVANKIDAFAGRQAELDALLARLQLLFQNQQTQCVRE